MSVLSEALALHNAGIVVLPLALDGSKQPEMYGRKVAWKGWKATRPIEASVRAWFAHGNAGIGTIGGAISGGLEALDFDRHHESDPDTFEPWRAMIPPELYARMVVYRSPGGGVRACWRCADHYHGSKLVLARHAQQPGEAVGHVAIELLSAQINVVPGGHPHAHWTCDPYVYAQGHLAEVQHVEPQERELLIEAATALDLAPRPKCAAPKPTIQNPDYAQADDRFPWSDFDHRGTWEEVLLPAGWTPVGPNTWRRPGKSDGVSATTNYYDGMFFMFSSSVPALESDRGYSRSALYALLHHDGDFSESNRALAEKGYGRANRDRLDHFRRIMGG